AVEQDRAAVRHDAGDVLQQRRQVGEVRVARLLHRGAGTIEGGGESLAHPVVARMRTEEQLTAFVRVSGGPPVDETLHVVRLVRLVRRRVPGVEDYGPGGIE